MPLLKLKKFLKRSSRGLGFAYPSYLSLKMFKLKLKKPAKRSLKGLDSDSTTPPPLSKSQCFLKLGSAIKAAEFYSKGNLNSS